MSERATADLIADLLLRHYREPMRYRAQAVREAETLGHLNVVLRLALGRPVELADPALRGPAAAAELERAAAFYIQQHFFRDGASHYEILGLAPDASLDSVRENFRLLMQLIHPDRHGADTEWPEGYAARANRAYSVLKGAQTRADYDRQQAAAHAQEVAARTQQSGRRARPSSARMSAAVTGTRMPTQELSGRQPLASPLLPEWLTAGVGGFILRHPAFTVFAALITVSALIIGAATWPERDNALNADGAYTIPEPVKRASAIRARVTEPPAAVAAPLPAAVAAPPPAAVALATPAPATVVARSEPSPTRAPPPTVVAPVRVAEIPTSAFLVALPKAAPAAPSVPAPLPVVSAPLPAIAAAPGPVPSPVQSLAAPPTAASGVVVASAVPAGPAASERVVVVALPPPGAVEVETLIAAFVSSYESGRLSVFGGLFHDDAQANQQRGRAAIVSEYDQLFRATTSRRMTISQMRWQAVGDRTEAKGELTMKTSWRDGREAEQRVAVDMELVRQGGRAVISRLGLQPR